MSKKFFAVLASLLGFLVPNCFAQDKCKTLDAHANRQGVRVSGAAALHTVTGQGRLQFYSAPDSSCVIKGVFILPGEEVVAYVEYNGYSAVMYTNPRTRENTEGWVATTRLQPTGDGIAPP